MWLLSHLEEICSAFPGGDGCLAWALLPAAAPAAGHGDGGEGSEGESLNLGGDSLVGYAEGGHSKKGPFSASSTIPTGFLRDGREVLSASLVSREDAGYDFSSFADNTAHSPQTRDTASFQNINPLRSTTKIQSPHTLNS